MFSSVPVRLGALALLLSAAGTGASRAGEQVLRFNDPASPGRVVIQMAVGDVSVTGADVAELTLTSSEPLGDDSEPREDGLRRLNPGNSYTILQEGNTITIRASGLLGGKRHFGGGVPNDLTLLVPRQTAVRVERTGPGDISVEHLTGDVEIRAMSGDVVLAGLAGGAVIETMNGDVDASFSSLPGAKPISISTANGDVDLRVPADAKATVRFSTLRGDMLTDFGADEFKTLTENIVGDVEGAHSGDQAMAEYARQEAQRAKDEARRIRQEAAAAKEEAKRVAGTGSAAGIPPVPPVPPMPPFPAVPTFSGGQMIAGDLNGGGTSITITTLSGEIRLRKTK